MSNVFFILKSKYLSKSISNKIVPFAILYDFLWIGGNNIGNYNINQYKGPKKNVKLFTKELNKILKNKKHSIISGNSMLPSEREFQINHYNSKPLVEPTYKKKLKFDKIKKIIKNLILTKYGFHLPILLYENHPKYNSYDIFFTFENNNLIIHGINKNSMEQTEAWLKRLEMLI